MPRQRKFDHSHPYSKFEKTGLWNALNEGIGRLVENQDLKETTPREYILGYLCEVLSRRRKTLLSK
jgi:hypothetical protein